MIANTPVNCTENEINEYLSLLREGYLPCKHLEQCTCSLDRAEGYYRTSYSGTNPSAPSKAMSIASKSCQQGKKTVHFPGFQSLQMCKSSMASRGAELSMSSQVDFLANPIVSQEAEKEETMNEISGQNWQELFQKYNLNTSSLKMLSGYSHQPLMCAYAAGLIDGEGSITLHKQTYKGEPSFAPEMRVSLAKKGLPVLEKMHKIFGGILRKHKDKKGNWEESWIWRIGGLEAGKFLMEIGPYLVLKQEQAVICLALLEMRINSTGKQINGNAIWTKSMRDYGQRLKDEMLFLNKRGTMPTLAKGAIAYLVDGEWMSPQMDLITGSLAPFLGTFPKSGSMRNGVLFQQPMLAQNISEKGFGALPNGETFFHTPNCTGLDGGSNSRKALKKRQETFATPTTMDSLPPKPEKALLREMTVARPGRSKSANLRDQVSNMDNWKMWPTPQTRGFTNDGDLMALANVCENYEEMSAMAYRAAHKKKAGYWPTPTSSNGGPNNNSSAVTERGHGINLLGAVMSDLERWPTPQSRDYKGSSGRSLKGKEFDLPTAVKIEGEPSRLNPDWTEWLMGWPVGYTSLQALSKEVIGDWEKKCKLEWFKTSTKTICDERMQQMQNDNSFATSPQRQEQIEQYRGKHRNIVSEMSSRGTHECRGLGDRESTDGKLQDMWSTVPTQTDAEGKGVQQRMPKTDNDDWCKKEMGDCNTGRIVENNINHPSLSAVSLWEEPEDLPRVTSNCPNRAARLKAIGNGQVPLCCATAFNLLMGRLNT